MPLSSKPAERRHGAAKRRAAAESAKPHQAPARGAQLESVLQLSRDLAQITDLRSCILKIYDGARQGLGFDRAGIFTFDAASDSFTSVIGTSRTGERDEISSTFAGSAAAGLRKALRTWPGYLFIEDYEAEFKTPPGHCMEGVKNNARVGLWAGQEPLGLICVDNLLTQRPFTEEQLEALRIFAGYAGVAIANARLLEALNASEKRFRAMIENSTDAIALLDRYGIVLYASPSTRRLLGYGMEDLAGHDAEEALHPDDFQRIRAVFDRLAQQPGATARDIFRVRHKDGSWRWIECLANNLLDDPAVRAIVINYRDISERKQAEDVLRQESDRLQVLMEQSPAIIWTTDTELKITSSLGAGLAGLGLKPNQTVGMSLYEYLGRKDREFLPTASHLRALAGESARYEMEWQGRTFQSRMDPLRDSGGAIIGVIGVALDVTERVQAEQQRLALERKMLETQKLESLGVLAGGIAHDFNNLLATILGNVSLAAMQLPAASPARPYLGSIETTAHRAAELCKQMLAYSGLGRFAVHPVNVNTIILEMAELLRVSIGKRVEVNYNLAESLPLVSADATQIRQVLMNLILNASEAIGDADGVIALATGTCSLDRAALKETYAAPDLPAGEYLFIEVQDTGCGMDAETRAKIFDPFFSTKFTGRGLGLAAVLGIVRGHGGAIAVDSAAGRGATFRVLLPRA